MDSIGQARMPSPFLIRHAPVYEEYTMSRKQLAKWLYVVAAAASFLLSVTLWFSGSKEQGAFVGLWVPSILSFGTLMMGGRHE